VARQTRRLKFDEFAAQIDRVFEEMASEDGEVMVEKAGRLFRIEPAGKDIWRGYDPERVHGALVHLAGLLAGVDRKALMRDIHAARRQASRGRPAR